MASSKTVYFSKRKDKETVEQMKLIAQRNAPNILLTGLHRNVINKTKLLLHNIYICSTFSKHWQAKR